MRVFVDITMSVDGFISGPGISREQPLGAGGLRLHDWFFKTKTEAAARILDEVNQATGAVILGDRTYSDAIDDAWGGENPFPAPAFVLCKRAPEKTVKGFSYVTDGIESALRQASAVAGEKGVLVMGGASVVQQYLKAGLIDDIQLHIAPLLLGEGTCLFDHIGGVELECTRVLETPGATHLHYRVVK